MVGRTALVPLALPSVRSSVDTKEKKLHKLSNWSRMKSLKTKYSIKEEAEEVGLSFLTEP